MNCFDRYRKRMESSGGSIKEERIKDTEKLIIESFIHNPSHRVVKRISVDLVEELIDVQLINISKSVYEKRIHVMPNMKLSVGDYINFEHKGRKHVYIIDDVEDNSIELWGNATECKNTLRWIDKEGILQEYPVVASYLSYGTKIFVSEGDFMDGISTNIDIEIPRNKITETIPLNLRFMLGNSEHGCYVVGDCAVYQENKLKLTCKKDRFIPNYDDVKNGLCWNKDTTTPPITPTEYAISGQDSIRKGLESTYTINEPNGSFEVDGLDYEIVSQDSESITIKCIDYGEFITINYLVDGEIVASKDVDLVR